MQNLVNADFKNRKTYFKIKIKFEVSLLHVSEAVAWRYSIKKLRQKVFATTTGEHLPWSPFQSEAADLGLKVFTGASGECSGLWDHTGTILSCYFFPNMASWYLR